MKIELDDLAIFGGMPHFAEPRHVGRPNIGDRAAFLARMHDLLDRRWLTNHGPYVEEFERRISEEVGANHCIAVCNATVGLDIVARAVGLSGEVIVPSFTFVATAHALQWQNIKPVFCDVDLTTHNLDPAAVETLITPRTSGILGVHVWGRGCAVDDLTEIADRHRLKLVFDAAHAFGCTDGGRRIGTFGNAEVFSFHATKYLNSFEGGAIVTNDEELATRVRLMTNFGFAGYDEVVCLGTNGKMSEASAAMGLTSLEAKAEIVEINRSNYQQYRDGLYGLEGLEPMLYDDEEESNYQYIVVEVDEEAAGITRDELLEILWAENVRARRYFYPGCHRMEPYATLFPDAGANLPATELLAKRVLLLPNGTAVTSVEIADICELIRFAARNGPELRLRLAAARRGVAARVGTSTRT